MVWVALLCSALQCWSGQKENFTLQSALRPLVLFLPGQGANSRDNGRIYAAQALATDVATSIYGLFGCDKDVELWIPAYDTPH